jgi:hypothetical protein
MEISNKLIQEMKDLLEKKEGREFTWGEASEAAYNLTGLAELCFDFGEEECRRKKKLEENPKGFTLEGIGYSCFICGNGTPAGGNWYDKYGIKCLTCQKAIDRKEIPASLAKDKESWYSKYDLESCFNIKGPALRKWIKDGIIKARTLTSDGKGVHYQLFLIKDNLGFLPPKKLVKSELVKETRDGKDWYHSEPWYKFVDAHEHLKGYKIMDHLRVTYGEGEDKVSETQ